MTKGTTKARTKAQKRRDKKERKNQITLAGGEITQPRSSSRQGQRTDLDPVALNARCRHAGLEENAKNRMDMSGQMLGCPVGRRISELGNPEERTRLWGAVQHMRRVYTAYYKAIAAPHPHAQCLRVLASAEIMHADASTPPVDTRPQEDRDRQDIRSYMALQGCLERAGKDCIGPTKRAALEQTDGAVRDWPRVKRGLRAVADGLYLR